MLRDCAEVRVDRVTVVLVSLLVVSIGLAALSNVTHIEFVGEDVVAIEAEPGITLLKLDLPGVVVASADLPKSVKVYLLDRMDYATYERLGTLPGECLSEKCGSVVVRNPAYVLVDNSLGKEASLRLRFTTYVEMKPYAPLSIASYLLAIGSLALLISKVCKDLKPQQ